MIQYYDQVLSTDIFKSLTMAKQKLFLEIGGVGKAIYIFMICIIYEDGFILKNVLKVIYCAL